MSIKAGVCNLSAFIGTQRNLNVIAAQWIAIFELDIVWVKVPAIARVFIMLNDNFTIEIVHSSLLVR
jgi:hypothetical protein